LKRLINNARSAERSSTKKKILTGPAARINLTGVARCGGAAVSARKISQAVSSASMKARKTMISKKMTKIRVIKI